ncbi:MAG: hypothetical protein KKD44_28240 [Proteobacteria bacterium]|nr:hypothetical protein [Pseudomonadota bacterium]
MKHQITLQSLDKKLDKILNILKPVLSPEQPTKWNHLKMLPEYTAQYLFNECKKLFPCYSHANFSDIKSDRSGKYEIDFKPNIEADEDYKNMSANEIKEKGIRGITLEERLLLELQYFRETGKHLDINDWTLCAGSRYSDGCIPAVYWFYDKLKVNYYRPDSHYDCLRARAAVPLATSSFNPLLLTFDYNGKKYKIKEIIE